MDSGEYSHKIRLIDSLNASLAQGILAIYASEMRDKGMAFDDVADELETYPARMNGVFYSRRSQISFTNRPYKRNQCFDWKCPEHQTYSPWKQRRIYCPVQKNAAVENLH